MSHLLQPSIILLRDGTDTSQGIPQLLSNIDACTAVVDVVKTTLGPYGMDKLIHSQNIATISNDGATIVKLLNIVHPASKCLTDIAISQDDEVGDGTTTVMILAGEFMKEAKKFIEDKVHPQLIIRAYQRSQKLCLDYLEQISVKREKISRDTLINCAATSLTSKLIGGISKKFFARIVVDSVLSLDDDLDIDSIGIKKVHGGAMEDTTLVKGVAFKKTFSYAGFEQQPKKILKPKVLCLKVELELKSESTNAEVKITNPDEYQAIIDAEWKIIYEKLEIIVNSGANVILSQLPIGDLATQYFADKGIFCAGRVELKDLIRVTKATGAKIQTTVSKLEKKSLGTCGIFEEKQVGAERFNFLTDCPNTQTSTIIIRGGAEQFIEESERSLHDAIMVVRRAVKNTSIVAGGGATEMELSAYLRRIARSIKGKDQLIINSFAKALEVIPKQLSENAGFNSIEILNQLRMKHSKKGGTWFGIDIDNEGICNTYDKFVWEPSIIKRNAIAAATQACCLILSIDETVKNPQNELADKKRREAQNQPLRNVMKSRL